MEKSNNLTSLHFEENDGKAQRIHRNRIEGTVLANRFTVGSLIGKGACGKVFKVYDSQNKNVPMALKISPHIDTIVKEIKAIVAISKRAY